ncbi:MAG: hypothetical protein WKG06_28075 [Segetibacter sp.]
MIKAVLIDDELQSSKSLSIKLAAASIDVDVLAVFEKPEQALLDLAELKSDVVFWTSKCLVRTDFNLWRNLEKLRLK